MAPKTPERLATLTRVRVGNRPALKGGWLFEPTVSKTNAGSAEAGVIDRRCPRVLGCRHTRRRRRWRAPIRPEALRLCSIHRRACRPRPHTPDCDANCLGTKLRVLILRVLGLKGRPDGRLGRDRFRTTVDPRPPQLRPIVGVFVDEEGNCRITRDIAHPFEPGGRLRLAVDGNVDCAAQRAKHHRDQVRTRSVDGGQPRHRGLERPRRHAAGGHRRCPARSRPEEMRRRLRTTLPRRQDRCRGHPIRTPAARCRAPVQTCHSLTAP